MAMEYPSDLQYLDSHEYIRVEGDTATIGITAFAIDQLGDVVFLELPEVGESLTKGETFGTVESVKAVEDLYAPVSGQVLARNDAILESPEQLAEDPYREGWLLKIKLDGAVEGTLSADVYKSLVEGH